jgi:hypothetical protein
MVNRRTRSVLCLALAALFFVGPFFPVGGETQTTFSGGAVDKTLSFAKNGGSDSTITMTLPKYIIVNSATIDIEGRKKLYDPVQGTVDFANPGASTAWDSSIAALPPLKPTNYETTNITLDRFIQVSDDQPYASKYQGAVACHMFEIYTGEVVLINMSFQWEGYGVVSGLTPGQNCGELYAYNATANMWTKMASYLNTLGDQVLWANISGGDWVDNRGYVTFVAAANNNNGGKVMTSALYTDYVKAVYNGFENFCPENVRLDIGGDGSIEYTYAGKLAENKTTFTGDAFVTPLQTLLDNSASQNVSVIFKFIVDKGGILFISNLSIDYTWKDLAPTTKGTMPQVDMNEDTNLTSALSLREYFNDDKGVNALVFAVSYEENASRVHAVVNADGYHLDLFTATRDWNGETHFRVNATDVSGQSVEAGTFKVVVNPVNDAPKLRQPASLGAREGTAFEYNLNATDVDVASDTEEKLAFSTNATFLAVDPDTGKMTFTPKNADVGQHTFWVKVTDHGGLCDTKTVSMIVENLNNGPSLNAIDDITVNEDETLTTTVSATDPDLDIGLDELSFADNSSLFEVAKNGTFTLAPKNKDVGVYNVGITVRDTGGLSDTKNFTITVLNVNDPPKIVPLANMTVDEDKNVSFRVSASDEDVGDVLTFKDDSPLFDIAQTGWVNFTPVQKDVGVHYVNFSVTDIAGLKVSFQMKITVVNVNEPPTDARIVAPANGTAVNYGTNITFQGTAKDEDGDALTYSWFADGTALGEGQSFATKALKSGKHEITLTVSDGNATVPGGSISLTVKAKKAAEKGLPGFEAGLLLLSLAAVGLLWRRKA